MKIFESTKRIGKDQILTSLYVDGPGVFYSIDVATQGDYVRACSALGLDPVVACDAGFGQWVDDGDDVTVIERIWSASVSRWAPHLESERVTKSVFVCG